MYLFSPDKLLCYCTRYCMYWVVELHSIMLWTPQYYALRSDNTSLCYCVRPSLLGSSTPYWSRINSEKTCPLMVFWNLSVWALNGAENWIVPKDCWRRKKTSVGAFLPRGSLLTNHRECINTPFTQLTLSSLDNGLDPMSVAPNFIWKIAQKCHLRSTIIRFQVSAPKVQINCIFKWIRGFWGAVTKTHHVCQFLARSLYQSINAK